ncbi:hypothetical protein ACHAWU_004355 [Discostella pseudostelligera]|uniref:SAM domain-containing protein n=1 Tax=Discostella pseudostelligera TaxID=259834 RepID=A0ABD3N3K5_9STRA
MHSTATATQQRPSSSSSTTDRMLRNTLVISPSRQGRSRNQYESPVSSDDQGGLHTFLHEELRISREVADLYCNSLIQNGYDDVTSLEDATENDLLELGVKIGHIRRIKRAVTSGGTMGSDRRATVGISNETPKGIIPRRKTIEESLLSDYARQEMNNYTPSSQGRDDDSDVVSVKERLIRQQAEKIAALEARLATSKISTNNNGNRGSSADTQTKKLTPEERLEMHKQRKLEESKYKEKTGVWEAPPPKEKENNLTNKVPENDDLVLKLTSDPTHRKQIDEVEKKMKKLARSSTVGEGGMKVSPPNSALSRSHSMSSPGLNQDRLLSRCRSRKGNRESSHIISSIKQNHATSSCETCGSTEDCEPDVDNPGIFYCKSCWEEYERALGDTEVHNQTTHSQAVHIQAVHSQAVHNHAAKNHPSNDEDPTQHHALWIVHDNPQLGEKIIFSGPKKMECMAETKEPGKKNCVRIIIGDIDFIGKVEQSGIGSVIGRKNEVGTECIRVRNVKGYYVDHNLAASRLSKDKSIYEFRIGEENVHMLTGKSASMSVGDFFKGCTGAIDVILDPQKDTGGWYPQKEAGSGGRRVAPQFRSKGVGYIRLGDDMSENGLAFLSSNGCLTFLSSVDSSKTNTFTSKILPPTTTKHSSKQREESDESLTTTPKEKPYSVRRVQPPKQTEPDEQSLEEESVDDVQDVSELLKQLQSADQANMKWKDKAELLSQIGKGAAREEGCNSRPVALNAIQDILGAKNGNVHVIRSSLIAVGMIGVAMGCELVCQNSWKTIMIESLKLLKSKQCGSVSKTVLAQLHGRCFTLANSMESISHVLGVGLTASTPKSRKSTANSPNSIEVIEWVAEITEKERTMEVIDPMLDENDLSMLINLFFGFAEHRDQRCRKNVYDGLLHCVLYGIQRLELDVTQVMEMCAGLKETNARSFSQIFSNAKAILEKEQR